MTKPVVNDETIGPVLNSKDAKKAEKARNKAIKELKRRTKVANKIIKGLQESQRVSQKTWDLTLD